jgi:putative hemolysin
LIAPLIKGYVKMDAYVGGERAWDPDLNTADLSMLLPLSCMTTCCAKHFLKHGA